MGKCTRCSNQAPIGFKRCDKCRAKAHVRTKARHKRNGVRPRHAEGQCTRCTRPATEGYKTCPRCRSLMTKYARAWQKRNPGFRKTINVSAAHHRAVKKYNEKNADWYKAWQSEYHKIWRTRAKNKLRISLRKQVHAAVRAGTLVRPSSCSTCGKTGKIVAFLGVLSLEDVTFHCQKCCWAKNRE
jgi:hypothetical protein